MREEYNALIEKLYHLFRVYSGDPVEFWRVLGELRGLVNNAEAFDSSYFIEAEVGGDWFEVGNMISPHWASFLAERIMESRGCKTRITKGGHLVHQFTPARRVLWDNIEDLETGLC